MNCFPKCGFGKTPGDPAHEPAVGINWCKLTIDSCTEEDFVGPNDHLATCGVCTVEDIAKELCTPDALTSDEEEGCGSSHDGPPTMAVTHLALDVLRHAGAGESIRGTTCAHFCAFQKGIVEDLIEDLLV